MGVLRRPRREARRAARSDAVGWLGRVGLAAQGICFGIIGVLAVALAAGAGGKATDPQGALNALASHGWSKVLLVVLCIGFVGYAIWRLSQALFDRGDMGSDARRPVPAGDPARPGAGVHGARDRRDPDARGRGRARGRRAACSGGRPRLARGPRARRARGGRPDRRRRRHGLLGAEPAVRGVAGDARDGRPHGTRGPGDRDPRASAPSGSCSRSSGGSCSRPPSSSIQARRSASAVRSRKLAHASYGGWLLGITAAGLIVFAVFDLFQLRYHEA